MEQALAKLYYQGIVRAADLSKAARILGLSLDAVLHEIELLGIPRQQVFQEAVQPSELSPSDSWQTFTLEEAVEALYNRAASNKEIAAKLGKTPKAVSNFRWRAFRQGFLVPKELWHAVLRNDQDLVREYGWRGEFARMLYQLTLYARQRKLQEPKIILED